MSRRSSAVGSFLASFEKTISANHAAGVTTEMYLNTILVKPPKDATTTKNTAGKDDSPFSKDKFIHGKQSVASNGESPVTRKSLDGLSKLKDMNNGSFTEHTSVTSDNSDISSKWDDNLSLQVVAESNEIGRRGRSVELNAVTDSIGGDEELHANKEIADVGMPTRKTLKDTVQKKSKANEIERAYIRDAREASSSPSSTQARNNVEKSPPRAQLSVDEHTNIAPVMDVKKLLDNKSQGECDLMQVSRSERRSSCSKRSSSFAQKQDAPWSNDVHDDSEPSCCESRDCEDRTAVHSFKLAPSDKDKGASRQRVKKPVAVVEKEVADPQEEDFEADLELLEEGNLPVRKIKLRAPLKNRKSSGRKRRTKRSNEMGKSLYKSDDVAGIGNDSDESDEDDPK